MSMRKTLTIGFILTTLIALLSGCQRVDRPAMGGQGPTSLQTVKTSIMPPYHTPLENWRKVHMDEILSGRLSQNACFICHSDPDQFCNRCHEYVGARKVSTGGQTVKQLMGLEVMEGLQPTPDHAPLDKWITTHDDAIINGQAAISACLGCHAEPDKFCNKCHTAIGVRKIALQ